MKIERIAIFGGTFNPPHKGHYLALKALIREMRPDKAYIVPNRKPLLKDEDFGDVTDEDRCQMIGYTFGQLKKASILRYELESQRESYTAYTVEYVKSLHPDSIIFLLIGTDQLLQLEKWYKFDYLTENCAFCVADRENSAAPEVLAVAEKLRRLYRAKIIFLNFKAAVVSSTQQRERLCLGQDCPELTINTMKYISEKELYVENKVIREIRKGREI